MSQPENLPINLDIDFATLQIQDVGSRFIFLRSVSDSILKTGITGYVIVDGTDKLPEPSGGVITLADNTAYLFTTNVDLNGDRLVCGANTGIFGTSSESASIISTGLTGVALITSQYSLPMRNIRITADIALDLAGDGVTTALDWNAVNFINCGVVGTVQDFSNFIYINGAMVNSGALTITGTFGTFGVNGCLFVPSTGSTSINIDSNAVFTRRFRIIYSAVSVPATSTGIYVDPSATIPTEAYILDTVSFSGAGTLTDGVDYTDNKALFVNNTGIINSAQIGQYYMNNNVTATTITGTGVPVKIAGTTTANAINQKFTHSNNRLTCTAIIERAYQVTATITMTSGNNNQIGMYVSKNGTPLDESEVYDTADGNGRLSNVTIQTITTLSDGDYIEIWVENNTAITNVTVESLNVIVKALN